METVLLYLAVGAFAGLLAGLLGIGGGLVIVPALTFTFAAQNMPHAHILHLALGTSLTTIIFTSISSLLAHHKRGAVMWSAVASLAPGILIGTFFGTWVAAQLTTDFLRFFFGVFLFWVATQMLLGIKPSATRELPGTAGMFTSGSLIGIFSSLVGIGGGSLSVPFLVFHNMEMHRAIGTAAAIGLPIALAGAVGNVLNGWEVSPLPAGAVGYVYLPGLFGISVASVCTAPLGAKLAHRLPVTRLKKIFAVLLYVVGAKMLFSGL